MRGLHLKIWAVAVCAIASASPSFAQSSKEYALMGKKAYAAFECAMLASFARHNDQTDRLFKIGYEQGKTFIEAVNSGKVTREDVNSMVPTGMVLALQGPTVDFILGRVWESIGKDVADKLYRGFPETHVPADDELAGAAQDRFSHQNCELIAPE